MTDKVKGNLALLFTTVVWGTGFIAQKLGNNVMPAMSFNAIRQLMAAIVLCPFLAASMKKSGYFSKDKNSREQLEYKKVHTIKIFFVCGFFMTFATMMQQLGLLTVSAGKSGFISALYIVFTPVIGAFFGDRVHFKTIGCIALAMGGFALLSLRGGLGGATAGDWLTLLSAIGFGAQITAVNHFVNRDNDILISVLQMAFCGTIGLVLSVLIEHPSWAQIWACMPILLYSTFVPTAIGYTFQIIGQKYTDSTTAALIMSLEAVFAAIFGAIFLKEWMSVREILGSAIIFAATIINQVEFKKSYEK